MITKILELSPVSFPFWMFVAIVILAVLFGAVAGFYYGFHLASKDPLYFDDSHYTHKNGTDSTEQE